MLKFFIPKSKNKELKTLIRSDSSSLIGHGHIRRDLVIAKNFKDISFACENLQGNIISEIPHKVFILKTNKINELIKLIIKNKIELLIIDHYEIAFEDEKKIKEKTKVKILCIDDEYKKHYCDIILNPNIYAQRKKYKNLIQKHSKIYSGKKYILVRDEFYKEKEIKREKIYDFCIILGGADVKNLSAKVASMLPLNSKIAILTTTSNANLENLKILANKNSAISLFINSKDIAKIMHQSKKLIITSSTIVHEAIILNLPFIAIKIAKNQKFMFLWLKKHGYKVFKEKALLKSNL